MATQLDATELLIWRAACLEDRGMSFEKEAAMAKMFASDVAMKAAAPRSTKGQTRFSGS